MFFATTFFVYLMVSVSRCDYNTRGILKVNEDKLRSLGSPRDQREAICRYLCGKGPVTVKVCFCKVDVKCMDSYCPKDKFCKSIDNTRRNLYACCPREKKTVPKECKVPRVVLQVKQALLYYRYNINTLRCEEAYLYTDKIRWRTVTGYSSPSMCRVCTLYDFCYHVNEEKFENLGSIFSVQETSVINVSSSKSVIINDLKSDSSETTSEE